MQGESVHLALARLVASPEAAGGHVVDAADDEYERPRRTRSRTRLSVNLTSLIDVTFLLLIYFMVATTMTSGEEAFRMDLPDRSGVGAASDPFALDAEPLRIEIASIPEAPGYQLRVVGPYPQPTTFEELYGFLRQRQIQPDVAGGMFPVDHPIVVEPVGATRWEHAIEAFNAAHRARYTNISFAKAR